jgi:hypothetical protein
MAKAKSPMRAVVHHKLWPSVGMGGLVTIGVVMFLAA